MAEVMGLLHSPDVLFLDEPTTGLDPQARAEMWHEIERLAREEQMTILLTTHYLEEADKLAATLAIVDRGRIVAEGSPEELKGELRGDAIQLELVEALADGRGPRALQGLAGRVVCPLERHEPSSRTSTAAAFASLSNGLGVLARQRESLIGAVSLVLLPLTFLSTALMQPTWYPAGSAPWPSSTR